MSEKENKKKGKIICRTVDLNKIPPEKLEKLKEMNAISFPNSPIDSPIKAGNEFMKMENYPTAEQTKELLKLNPPLNQMEDEKGASPLAYAVMFAKDVEVVKLLLDAGADINKKAKNGWNIFMLCVARSQTPEIISYLLTRFPKNKKEISELLLNAVASSTNTDIIKVLLDKGADINYKNEKGITPLRASMNTYSPKVIKFLINEGAQINMADNNGTTPLIDAATGCKDTKVFEILLQAGANPKLVDKNGLSALIYAATYNSSEEVIDILDSVYPDQKQLDKALYMAARYNTSTAVIGKLLDLGATLEFKDNNGENAYDWGKRNSNMEVRKQFENKIKFEKGTIALLN